MVVPRLRSIIAWLLGLLIGTPVSTAQWELLPDRAHDVELSTLAEDADAIGIRTTGRDPYLIGRWSQQPGGDERILEFEYFCPAGVESLIAFAGPPFSPRHHAKLPALPIAQGWQIYKVDLLKAFDGSWPNVFSELRLDFGDRPNQRIQIRNVHLRPRREAEKQAIADEAARRARKQSQAKKIAEYLLQTPPVVIDAVIAGDEWIRLAGPSPNNSDSWQLIEYRANQSIFDDGIVVDAIVDHSEGRFQIAVPRRVGSRDRLYSGWRLRDSDGRYLSARHYASEIEPSGDDFAAARPTPASQKGLTCFSRRGPLQDLLDLDVSAVTINLVLNRFVVNSPGRGSTPIPGAKDIYFNEHALGPYDSLTDFARRNGIVVTAIVLIPRSKSATDQSPLVHPESDGGVYAMPDLTSERAAGVYAYVLGRIADRYSNTEKSPGGITNWIVHNEVDFHHTWTNMGTQPREVYTETFYRSMRIIHNAARRHNPHARVFVPLTHHWVVAPDGKWRQLAPRECLQTLQRYSKLEGEFAWGVAYHPYPQNLFTDVAWKDTRVQDDFDTPLITMQNIDVLGRFLSQPSMCAADGKMRPVLLSEQGFHTDSYDDQSQANQAGSLWYAMKKVRQMPWIESFHYHRWIDHPAEGGLKLGLRTLPNPGYPHGQKKRSWYVYRAIGTSEEEELTQDLPQ